MLIFLKSFLLNKVPQQLSDFQQQAFQIQFSMAPKKPEREGIILAALQHRIDHPEVSVRKIARLFSLSNTTLQNRLQHKTTPSPEAHEQQQLLTKVQESVIIDRIKDCDDRGIPLRRRHVLDMVYQLQKVNGKMGEIGKHWVDRFIARHPEIQSKVGKTLDKQRSLATDPAIFKEHLNRFYNMRCKYHIKPENTWNTDEKGFAMGLGGGGTILCRAGRKNPRIMQDGKRSWVTVVEAISGNWKSIAPLVIHASNAHLMGHHSNINYEKNTDAFFTHSKAGYTTTVITLDWLVKIFEPRTRPESGIKEHRMLVLDGHSSHVNNIEFIEYCIKMNIHLICLPGHTTHVLQPLDIGIFSPMGTSYRKELEDFLRDHGPNWAMHKGDFYPMYHKARAKAMSEGNILSAWRASGMIPFNRHRVLTQSGLQMCTPQSKSMNEQRSGLRPLPTRAETSSELDKIREEANRLEFGDASRALLNQALDLCSKANTQSVLDAATITRLQAVKPSTTDRRQIKGGLILHTSVLSTLYKKRESDDKRKKELAVKKRLSRQQQKSKSQAATARGKAKGKARAGGNLESTGAQEDEMDCDECSEPVSTKSHIMPHFETNSSTFLGGKCNF